ncbi:VWA domain-containing protein [Nitrosophilus kaiyonis]|uniref:VWA domain-containing protein n=1 Tax=Nitrosophilus kaiyonis TaxID=2930200 RepID=UPI002492E126|nr:VWA domain-containing protein [Nitrosophilus kaiyonis]
MKILNIEYIYLMLIPSLVLLYLISTNKSELERVFDSKILKRLKINRGLDKNTKIFLLFFALFLMIFAMSRPVIQKGVVEVETKKAPVVFALDISKSMLSKDFYPNRLEFAKLKIINLVNMLKNVQFGAVAFAKEAFIVSPLTNDKEAFLFLIKNLNTDFITMQGTNFLSAIEIANTLFENKKDKNLIIFTDGGDKKSFEKEIELAKKYNIKVSVLAVASKKGAPIPINGGYLKDKNQNIVITKLNENIYSLCKKSGGICVNATLSNEDIKKISSFLNHIKKEIKKEKVIDQVELAPYFMGLALFLLSLVFFSIPSKSDFKKIFVFAFLIISINAKAGLFDFKDIKKAKEYYNEKNYQKALKYFKKVAQEKKSAQSFYDLANAYYKTKQYKKAIEYYNKVQTPNKELERYKLHNLGNSYFMLKQYKKAIEFYEKALKIKEDPDTRYNLELAKKMLKKISKNSQNQNKKQKEKKSSNKGKESQNKTTKKEKKNEKPKNKKKSKKSSKEMKNLNQKIKEEPISKREEKKWLKEIRKKQKTLIYKIPTKHKGIEIDKPW